MIRSFNLLVQKMQLINNLNAKSLNLILLVLLDQNNSEAENITINHLKRSYYYFKDY